MPFLYHPLYLFQMADGPGKPIDYRFLILMDMTVRMGDAVGVQKGMVMLVTMFMAMRMIVVMFVNMIFHMPTSFILYIISYFLRTCKPPGGMFSEPFAIRAHILFGGDFMAIVQTDIPITSASNQQMIGDLMRTYPFCRTETIATTAFQRPISTLVIGNGPRKVLFTAAHHANEWITALVLLKFAEAFAQAIQTSGTIGGENARALAEKATVYMIPLVNPDGVDLVTGALQPGNIQYDLARRLAQDYPTIPFPNGWKANLLGVDLNLQYPAGWLKAREIKFSQGYTSPGPRDYVGRAPLNQLETRALAEFTEFLDPELILAYHTQGKEIYWQFQDIVVPGTEELGQKMAQASGYTLANVPYGSGFAGYKDWFLQNFRRPGYTIEAGSGENPLPLSQFQEIYQDNLPILILGILGLDISEQTL